MEEIESYTYRRLMPALSEYRHPPRSGDTFAVVKQANIAKQNVIYTMQPKAESDNKFVIGNFQGIDQAFPPSTGATG